MKSLVGLFALIFVAVAGWQLGSRLSSDAIGMALGVLFGIMAGIPAALMVLAARRHEGFEHDEPRRSRRQQPQQYGAYPQFPQQQPPVIVVTGQGGPGGQGAGYGQGYSQGGYGNEYGQQPLMQPNQMQLPGPTNMASEPRQFRVVGETEEPLDSW